jgi:hypothetical protein
VNVFNEMYGDISRSNENSLSLNAQKASRLLAGYGSASSSFLVVEPGFPRCGEFISLLRGAFLEQGVRALSPCPHDKLCPMQGKKRWCHFAFETDDAPQDLHRLSQAAGLPKERAVLSFLFSAAENCRSENGRSENGLELHGGEQLLRIISDAFPLPYGRFGRYCCSGRGLVLLAGDKNTVEKNTCGSLANAVIKEERDPKSGALIARLSSDGGAAQAKTQRKSRKRHE